MQGETMSSDRQNEDDDRRTKRDNGDASNTTYCDGIDDIGCYQVCPLFLQLYNTRLILQIIHASVSKTWATIISGSFCCCCCCVQILIQLLVSIYINYETGHESLLGVRFR